MSNNVTQKMVWFALELADNWRYSKGLGVPQSELDGLQRDLTHAIERVRFAMTETSDDDMESLILDALPTRYRRMAIYMLFASILDETLKP